MTRSERPLLDNDTPCEDNRKGGTSTSDTVYKGGRVQPELRPKSAINQGRRVGKETHWAEDKIVHKPREGDGGESNPVALNDQPVRDFCVLHGITSKSLGLFYVDSPN